MDDEIKDLEGLIKDLKSGNVARMHVAGIRIAEIRDSGLCKRAVSALIEVLLGDNALIKPITGHVLVRIGKPAVPALIGILGTENILSRTTAILALGEIGDVSAVAPLIELLKHGKEQLQEDAGMALGDIAKRNPRTKGLLDAVPALIGALISGKTELRITAVTALGHIGDASAVPALAEALKDENDDVQIRAVISLLGIGDSSVVPVLIAALDYGDPALRFHVSRGLESIVRKCETMEEVERIESQIEEFSAASREKHADEGTLADVQMQAARVIGAIAKKKNEFAPKKDLLLDDKPKPPKKGRGIYQTVRRSTTLRN